ncbi:MAG: type II CAAX prenyl endopeptidase Rce1 family protein, partial [Candidatus Kryptoniota bacterium]
MTIAVSAARMRDRLGKLLRADRRIIAAELVVVCAVYSLRLFPFGTQVYLLVFASLSLWLRGMSWRDLGLRRAEVWWKITLKALLAAFLIAVVVNLLVEPFVERLINSVANNARVESVRGNLRNLLLWLLAVWTIVAFGEEMIFRGYLMNRIADLVGRSRTGWILSLLGSTLIFGLAHEYQ